MKEYLPPDQEYVDYIASAHPIQIDNNRYQTLVPKWITSQVVADVPGVTDPSQYEKRYSTGNWIPGGALQVTHDSRHAFAEAISGCPELALFASYVALRDNSEVTVTFNRKTYKSHVTELDTDFETVLSDLRMWELGRALFHNQQITIKSPDIFDNTQINDRQKMIIAASSVSILQGIYVQL